MRGKIGLLLLSVEDKRRTGPHATRRAEPQSTRRRTGLANSTSLSSTSPSITIFNNARESRLEQRPMYSSKEEQLPTPAFLGAQCSRDLPHLGLF